LLGSLYDNALLADFNTWACLRNTRTVVHNIVLNRVHRNNMYGTPCGTGCANEFAVREALISVWDCVSYAVFIIITLFHLFRVFQ
jgi:hypothetical protein